MGVAFPELFLLLHGFVKCIDESTDMHEVSQGAAHRLHHYAISVVLDADLVPPLGAVPRGAPDTHEGADPELEFFEELRG
jgi:hypothetical protein